MWERFMQEGLLFMTLEKSISNCKPSQMVKSNYFRIFWNTLKQTFFSVAFYESYNEIFNLKFF